MRFVVLHVLIIIKLAQKVDYFLILNEIVLDDLWCAAHNKQGSIKPI